MHDRGGCAAVRAGTPVAFAADSFIGDAVVVVEYALEAGGGQDNDAATSGYGPWGMVGLGNIALLTVGLVGLALTRRRDHPPA